MYICASYEVCHNYDARCFPHVVELLVKVQVSFYRLCNYNYLHETERVQNLSDDAMVCCSANRQNHYQSVRIMEVVQ